MPLIVLLLIGLHLNSSSRGDAPGFVEFMAPDKLRPIKEALPKVLDPELTSILSDPGTMFYDHVSLRPVYQDSITPVLGVRANTLGIKIAVEGERIFNSIGFHFPFKNTAGLSETAQIITFWAPPRVSGRALPVIYWKDDTTRWRWLFPKDTVFGEILYQIGPGSRPVVFEIRTRKRFIDGWAANAHRPFPTAATLADAIQRLRPQWASTTLKPIVDHLLDNSTLQTEVAESSHFPQTFAPTRGALDRIPQINDDALVTQLLAETPFASAEGRVWKRNSSQETYAASSRGGLSIVSPDYRGGLFPVNDISCNRCHDQVGRQIGEFNFNTLLYGEIWGEDRIFSWHLFDESGNFDGAYHENRILNKRFQATGLVEKRAASHDPQVYRDLPRPFKIHWR